MPVSIHFPEPRNLDGRWYLVNFACSWVMVMAK